jgi:tetratricopeptide (TPR) repeat protein
MCGGCATTSVLDESQRLASLGDYHNAFAVLDTERSRQLAGGDVSEELETAYQSLRLKFLRDRAQRRIFREREEQALQDLDLVTQVDPDYPGIKTLRLDALSKKARRIVDRGDHKLSQNDFSGAMADYLASQRLVPNYAPAKDGMEQVRLETLRLDVRAQQQFLQAVRKVPEFRHMEVAWHAAAVIHLAPNTSDQRSVEASVLQEAARKESAQEVLVRAKECEDANQFGAARMLYVDARRLNPEIDGVEEAIVKMDRELEALSLLERAEIKMRNQLFGEADELLKEAYKLSTFSRGAISELMLASRRLRGKQKYRHARDLEVMGKKIEALAAFEVLANEWPKGFEDEAARIVGLTVDVDSAKAEWQAAEEAEAAGKLVEALDHYLTAERFYAEWRDGEVHIARLRKAIAAKSAGESGGGGQ